jgi:hypothetical protein
MGPVQGRDKRDDAWRGTVGGTISGEEAAKSP